MRALEGARPVSTPMCGYSLSRFFRGYFCAVWSTPLLLLHISRRIMIFAIRLFALANVERAADRALIGAYAPRSGTSTRGGFARDVRYKDRCIHSHSLDLRVG